MRGVLGSVLLSLVVVAVGCSAPQAPDVPRDSLGRATVVVTESDDHRTVGVQTGAEVILQLRSAPPAEWIWHLVDPLDASVARLATTGYRPPVGGGPDDPGLAVFTFRAVGPGSVTVHMVYGPVGDPSTVANEFTFVLSVT